MYAPIFLPPVAKPSPDVLAAERAIRDAEGPSHVEGRYYRRTEDADRQRRLVAERHVRDAARRSALGDRLAVRVEPEPARDGDRPRPAVAPLVRVRPAVATWLTPRECGRVDAATADDLIARHHDTLRAVSEDLARGVADGALVSAARLTPTDMATVAALVRGFPGSPVVAFVDDTDDAHALASALLLGRAGVRALVDVRTAHGWRMLRDVLSANHVPDAFRRHAVASVLSDITGSAHDAHELPAGCAQFFALVFMPRTGSAKAIAANLGVHPTTLCSRFLRAGLPSPKRYATAARLVLAAHLAERPGVRLADLAQQLGVSSAQGLGRTIRTETGLRTSAFRAALDGAAMLDRFCASLVAPYRDRLRTFDPTSGDATTAASGQTTRVGRAA